MRILGSAAKKTFRKLHERPVPIVADAAIATGIVGDGRLIPLIILDTSDRHDLEELIRVHQYVRPGDVLSQWATIEDGSGRIALLLTFEKPMAVTALIAFDMTKHGGLIDQIIRTKGLYVQAGNDGDRLIDDLERPKLILEIPDTGFSRTWDDLLYKSVVTQMREGGLSRREAKDAARLYIIEWRKFGDFRMRSCRTGTKIESASQ
jgi:hypothetical protein